MSYSPKYSKLPGTCTMHIMLENMLIDANDDGEDKLDCIFDRIRDSKTTYFRSCRYSKGHYILWLHIIE